MNKAERDEMREIARVAKPASVWHVKQETILALLDAIPEWRPMETAPKDGTRVLLQFECPRLVRICHFHPNGAGEGRWWDDGNMQQLTANIVAWMPLPEVPDA